MSKLSDILQGVCLCMLTIWAIGFTACQDEYSEPTGFLYLNVEEDATLLTKVAVVDESLQVAIVKADGDTLKMYQDYLREVKGERLILPVGTYTVAVSSNHDGKAHWETPFYAGSEEVTVKQGEIANVKVTCTIANTKVSVKYADTMREYFSDYQTTVSNGSGELVYTRDEYRSGYFAPEKLTVQLDLVNRNGNKFALKRVYPDVKPKTHYEFKFQLADPGEDDEAGIDMDVSIDKEGITYIEKTIFIKEEDDLFGKGAPTLTLGAAFVNGELAFKRTEETTYPEDATFTIETKNGIQSVELLTESIQFDPKYDLSNWPSQFPTIEDKEVQVLDLLPLLEYLQPDGTKTAHHKFTLSVLDNYNQESTISFTVSVKANVPIALGTPVVWAKFAVLVAESEDMEDAAFYYRKKGIQEYETIEGNAIVKDPANARFTTLISNLEPNTTYEYMAVTNGSQTEWSELTTETAPMGDNMGFENWCEVDGLPKPWGSGDTNPFWNCGNTSVNVVVTIKAIMTQKDETNKTEGNYSVSMTSATQSGTKFAAGNIFTGDFALDGMNGVLSLGRPFEGRPSQLKGQYKYIRGTSTNKGSGSHLEGEDGDLCSIYVALTDEKMKIHTGQGIYFDPSNPAIIAYGELPIEKSRGQAEFAEFTIDFEYRSLERIPRYIIIVASSSRYGDYFEGRENSQMWLDDLRLVYPNSWDDIKTK